MRTKSVTQYKPSSLADSPIIAEAPSGKSWELISTATQIRNEDAHRAERETANNQITPHIGESKTQDRKRQSNPR